jgi:hypothetical protein
MMGSYEYIPFRGELQKMRLIANNMGYGPLPAPGEEVEQRLTLTANGKVWLSRFSYHDTAHNSLMSRKQFTVDHRCVESLFQKITTHFAGTERIGMATDVAAWELELTNAEGTSFRFTGPMLRGSSPTLDAISDELRSVLDRKGLFAFDGEPECDRINRIAVNYQFIRHIQPSIPVFGSSPITRTYGESLIIDRASETIEYHHQFGTACETTHRYHVHKGVPSLLDALDVDTLFRRMTDSLLEREPVDSDEEREYNITVDYEVSPQLVLSGCFDCYGLPEDWSDFVECLKEFFEFYHIHDLLNENYFKKPLDKSSCLAFCLVEFEPHGKTYYYLDRHFEYKVGDQVTVPVGDYEHILKARVVQVEYFKPEDAPFPLDRIKEILPVAPEDLDERVPEDTESKEHDDWALEHKSWRIGLTK